jgi:hypothetical protein
VNLSSIYRWFIYSQRGWPKPENQDPEPNHNSQWGRLGSWKWGKAWLCSVRCQLACCFASVSRAVTTAPLVEAPHRLFSKVFLCFLSDWTFCSGYIFFLCCVFWHSVIYCISRLRVELSIYLHS